MVFTSRQVVARFHSDTTNPVCDSQDVPLRLFDLRFDGYLAKACNSINQIVASIDTKPVAPGETNKQSQLLSPSTCSFQFPANVGKL